MTAIDTTSPFTPPASAEAFTQADSIPTEARDSGDPSIQHDRWTMHRRPATWLTGTLSKLDQLRELGSNWNSYGARPISPRSIAKAENLLRELALVESIDAPLVTASPDGNAALCWENAARLLDVEVFSDGQMAYGYVHHHDPSRDEDGRTRDLSVIGDLLLR